MRTIAGLVGLALLVAPSAARASPPSILWPEENPRFHPAEYGFTAAVLILNLFNEQLIPGVDRELWHGGILFDDQIDRWAVGAKSPANDAFTRAGDFAMYSLVAFPFVIDALLVSLLLNASPDIAWQVTMISAQALLTSSLLNVIAKRYLTRNRPATPRCDGGDDCPNGSAIHSFYSGHSAQMFAGAGVICANHVHLRLFGNRAADYGTCAAALTAATVASISRVTNRSHYTSDVVIGAGIGLLIGYAMPWLFHYRNGVITPLAGEVIGAGYFASF
jgi:hypothetical protein